MSQLSDESGEPIAAAPSTPAPTATPAPTSKRRASGLSKLLDGVGRTFSGVIQIGSSERARSLEKKAVLGRLITPELRDKAKSALTRTREFDRRILVLLEAHRTTRIDQLLAEIWVETNPDRLIALATEVSIGEGVLGARIRAAARSASNRFAAGQYAPIVDAIRTGFAAWAESALAEAAVEDDEISARAEAAGLRLTNASVFTSQVQETQRHVTEFLQAHDKMMNEVHLIGYSQAPLNTLLSHLD